MIRKPCVVSDLALFLLNGLILGRVALAAHTSSVLRNEPTPYSALVGNVASFHGYLNGEFNQIVVELSTRHRWQSVPPRTDGVTSTKLPKQRAGRAPKTLLFLIKFHWNYGLLAKLGPRVAQVLPDTTIMAHVDDLHWYDQSSFELQRQALNLADLVTATYVHNVPLLYAETAYGIRGDEMRHRHPMQLAWLPHATTPQFFVPVQEPTAGIVNKVLLSGATNKEWYPYRHMVAKWSDDQRFVVLSHPGYTHFQGSTHIGREFALQLNRHIACMTDGLHLNYTIAKIFEIPAAGCLLLINSEMKPFLARLGFFEAVHFLAYDDASSLRALVERVLDPRSAKAIHVIRRGAQQLVWRRHIVARRAAELDCSASE